MRLFCFGMGYSARRLAAALAPRGWRIAGTCRDARAKAELESLGTEAFLFDRDTPLPPNALHGATHLLSSVPPDDAGDPVIDRYGADIARIEGLAWTGYLSTTGVYGDTGGARVEESARLRPTSARGRRRVAAEAAWLALHQRHDVPVHIFRLAGIYGPGRSAIDQVRARTARRIDRPGHRFSRIHVDDIAAVVTASIARPAPGAVYNLCDDEPAQAADVVAFACALLGAEAPPLVPFAEAEKNMSAMARSFWRDNRVVDNCRIKKELSVTLRYPDFRAGLSAILAEESGA
jgi:nucleoside-diphosphate-sugar epimerase